MTALRLVSLERSQSSASKMTGPSPSRPAHDPPHLDGSTSLKAVAVVPGVIAKTLKYVAERSQAIRERFVFLKPLPETE